MNGTRRFIGYGRFILFGGLVLGAGLGSARAQIVVTDPATTTRNVVSALLKSRIVEIVTAQHERLRRMARRLSDTLDHYAVANSPPWERRDVWTEVSLYARGYYAALGAGDATGAAYMHAARTRRPVGDALARLSPAALEVVAGSLATLDAADSTLILSTHQAGVLRSAGRREAAAIDRLETHVLDPSPEQSATAVLDKISAAVHIGTRQKQARLQVLAGIVEQLVLENKRARDTEAGVLNMQLGRLHGRDWSGEGGGFLAGAADDLRTWRQP